VLCRRRRAATWLRALAHARTAAVEPAVACGNAGAGGQRR